MASFDSNPDPNPTPNPNPDPNPNPNPDPNPNPNPSPNPDQVASFGGLVQSVNDLERDANELAVTNQQLTAELRECRLSADASGDTAERLQQASNIPLHLCAPPCNPLTPPFPPYAPLHPFTLAYRRRIRSLRSSHNRSS